MHEFISECVDKSYLKHTFLIKTENSVWSNAWIFFKKVFVYKILYRRAPRLAYRLHVQPLGRVRVRAKVYRIQDKYTLNLTVGSKRNY